MSFRAEKAAYQEGLINETARTLIFPLPWTSYGAALVFLTVLSWLTNGTVLMVFILHRQLISSFTVYIISLLIANLLQTAIMSTIDIVDSNSLYWWMGSRTCDLYQYVAYVVGAGIVYSHVLITVNRVWAVTSPISYRNYHTKKMALWTCFFTWFGIHIFCIPGLVVESLYYRIPENKSDCSVNPVTNWKTVAMLVLFDFPILLVVGAYPLMWWMHVRRLKGADKLVETTVSQGHEKKPPVHLSRHARSSEAFLALTVTTCSLLLCWTPIESYVTAVIFTDGGLPLFYDIALFLYYLQPVLDPVLFSLALKDLRTAVKSLVPCSIGSKIYPR